MPHPLDSAHERLKRADENIRNLNGEITEFLKPVPVIIMPVDVNAGKPIITDENREAWNELTDFIKNQTVRPRFRVLTGEIVHHLRSAFDHLAWQLSSPDFQAQHPERIEFPVFADEPKLCAVRHMKKHEPCHYCRKIQGIASLPP